MGSEEACRDNAQTDSDASNAGPPPPIYVGYILAVLASMTGTVGKQLFRFSELQRRKGTKAGFYMAKVALVTALVLNVAAGPLIDMASYAFAKQSKIAPLGALDIVWNTLSAPFTLGESLTPMLVFGCALIFGGAVTTSVVGNEDDADPEYDLDCIKAVLVHWRVVVYLVVLIIWLAFNITVLMPRSAAPAGEPWQSGDRIRGLSLGMTAGSIAGNMFCVKAFVEIVQGSIAHNTGEYFAHWLPWVVLVGAVIFAVSNLYFLTKAMREYEAVFMGAIFEGSLIFAASVSGCIVFKELEGKKAFDIIGYWVALGVIILGIGVVAEGAKRKQMAEEKEAEPDEEAVENATDQAAMHADHVTKTGSSGSQENSTVPKKDHVNFELTRQSSGVSTGQMSSSFGHIPSLLTVPELPAALDSKSDCGSSDTGSMSAFSARSARRDRSDQGSKDGEAHHDSHLHGSDRGGTGRTRSSEPARAMRHPRPSTIQEVDDESATPQKSAPSRSHSRASLQAQETAANRAYLANKAYLQQGLFRNIVLEPNALRAVAACVGATGMGRLAATSRLAVDGLAATLHEVRGLPGRWTYVDDGTTFTYCIRATEAMPSVYHFEEKLRDGSTAKGILTQKGDWAMGMLHKGGAVHGYIRVRITGEYTAVSNFRDEGAEWGRDAVANRANYEAMLDGDFISLPSRQSSLDVVEVEPSRRTSRNPDPSGPKTDCPSSSSLLAAAAPRHCGPGSCMGWLLGGNAGPQRYGCGRLIHQEANAATTPPPKQASGVQRMYRVDNSRLQADSEGLALRNSKCLEDCDWHLARSARWGEVVVGREEGDGWLRVGDHYLPLFVEGMRVLVELHTNAQASNSASQFPQWTARDSFALCKDGAVGLYTGSAAFLDKQAASSVAAAVDSLNSGRLQCSQDVCVVFSAEDGEWWAMYRRGRRSQALRAFELPDPEPKPREEVRWYLQDSFFLCRAGEDATFNGKAPRLEPLKASSVRAAVERLNQGSLVCQDDCCLVFNSRLQEWHVLHRPGKRKSALERLGLPTNGAHNGKAPTRSHAPPAQKDTNGTFTSMLTVENRDTRTSQRRQMT